MPKIFIRNELDEDISVAGLLLGIGDQTKKKQKKITKYLNISQKILTPFCPV